MGITHSKNNEVEFTIRHRDNKYKHYKITMFKDNESIATIKGPKDRTIKVDAYWEVNRLFKSLTKFDPKETTNEPHIVINNKI